MHVVHLIIIGDVLSVPQLFLVCVCVCVCVNACVCACVCCLLSLLLLLLTHSSTYYGSLS